MSDPKIVVLPASGSGPQSDEETSAITETIQHALEERKHPKAQHDGPLKQIYTNSDSLYRYINWEDPVRTLAVYLGATGILFGVHYLPLTQLALKAGVATFGVVSFTEFASRSFSEDSLSTRLRPKEYMMIPESTLNATLKDIHDLIQFTVVQVQRIVFGQDLNKTFAAFLGCFGLFWLAKLISPFMFALMGLNALFLAPLVTSEQGRKAARDASAVAQDLGNVAAEKGKQLGQAGHAKASELSSKGQQTATNLSGQVQDAASNMSNKASDLTSRGQQAAGNLSAQARGTASDMSNKASDLSSRGHQTASDLSAQAGNTASDVSGRATEAGLNAVNSTYGTATEYVGHASNNPSQYTNGYSTPDRNPFHQSNSASDPMQQKASEYQAPASYSSGQIGAARADAGYVPATPRRDFEQEPTYRAY